MQEKNTSVASSLFEAISLGDVKAVKSLLSKEVSPNEKMQLDLTSSKSLLNIAIEGNIQDVKLLLDGEKNIRANINARDKYGVSPLHIASGTQNTELVEFLLSQGADVNAQNYAKETPLHVAVSKNYREVAELLIQSGAHTNIPDRYGRIPVVTKDELRLKQVAVPDRDSYHTIMRKLNERIETVEKLVNAFKFSKETKNVVDLPLPPREELSSEEIILITQAKAESRGEHKVDRQYLLIDNKPTFKKLSSKINENVQNNIPFNYYIIAKCHHDPFKNSDPLPGKHCTPIRIDYNGEDIKFAYIDTLPFSENMMLIDKLYNSTDIEKKEQIFYIPKEYILNGTSKIEDYLQRDNVSCSIFAIQDLNTMSKINRDDLSKHITPKLDELYPGFVKNSQNMLSVQKSLQKDDHKSEIVRKGKTLQEHIEEFCIETLILDDDTLINNAASKKVVTQNMAIWDKTLKYLNAAKQTLEHTYAIGGEGLVQKIMDQRAGSEIFEFPKHTNIFNFNNSKTQNKSPTSLLNGRRYTNSYTIKNITTAGAICKKKM